MYVDVDTHSFRILDVEERWIIIWMFPGLKISRKVSKCIHSDLLKFSAFVRVSLSSQARQY